MLYSGLGAWALEMSVDPDVDIEHKVLAAQPQASAACGDQDAVFAGGE